MTDPTQLQHYEFDWDSVTWHDVDTWPDSKNFEEWPELQQLRAHAGLIQSFSLIPVEVREAPEGGFYAIVSPIRLYASTVAKPFEEMREYLRAFLDGVEAMAAQWNCTPLEDDE